MLQIKLAGLWAAVWPVFDWWWSATLRIRRGCETCTGSKTFISSTTCTKFRFWNRKNILSPPKFAWARASAFWNVKGPHLWDLCWVPRLSPYLNKIHRDDACTWRNIWLCSLIVLHFSNGDRHAKLKENLLEYCTSSMVLLSCSIPMVWLRVENQNSILESKLARCSMSNELPFTEYLLLWLSERVSFATQICQPPTWLLVKDRNKSANHALFAAAPFVLPIHRYGFCRLAAELVPPCAGLCWIVSIMGNFGRRRLEAFQKPATFRRAAKLANLRRR